MAVPRTLLSLLLGACLAVALATPEGQLADDATLLTKTPLAEQPQALAAGPEGSADEDSTTSILSGLWDVLNGELRSPDYQQAIALVAFLVGLLLCADSRSSIGKVVVAVNMVLAGVFAKSEFSSFFHSELRDGLILVVCVQAAILAGWATMQGMDGVLIVVVALLSASLAKVLQGPLISVGVTQLRDAEWYIAVYYSVFFWLAVGLYKKNYHRHVLAVAGSLVGSALIVSSMAWAATFVYLQRVPSEESHAEGGDWLDFFQMLFTLGSRDLGIFAGSQSPYQLDILACRVFWLELFFVAVFIQVQRLKKSDGAGSAKAREGLLEALLVAEV